MPTISPNIFPGKGLRPLSSKEIMQRAKALKCSTEKDSAPSCSGQVNVGIFFDGTGNNMEADYRKPALDKRKHSNIVKLFNTFPDNNAGGFFRYYIPGVGTPFPQIGDTGGTFGSAFAWDGENRLTWALTRLLNTPHLFVNRSMMLDDARSATIANNMASVFTPPALRREIMRNWQKTLMQAIANKKPAVEVINLSVFGFSRGAAEARAFSNWLFESCEKIQGQWFFAGIPIRLSFLGIFDTVASVGIPNTLPNFFMEGHQSWADGNMEIHPAIEQCVHFVAGHEVRASFPLDSVRVNDKYPPNAKEVMYPGSHSDVGGGYAPNDVGIAPSVEDFLAIIPGAQMYQEARVAGVPLRPWNELPDAVKRDFTPAEKTVIGFNNYIKSAAISSGPVEDLHKKNMSLYLSYRYKYRNNTSSLPFYGRASAEYKRYITITSETFNKRLRRLNAYPFSPTDNKYSAMDAVAMQNKMTVAAGFGEQDEKENSQLYEVIRSLDEKRLSKDIEDFFGNYIHDSMAGFIAMGGSSTNEYLINGQGIMRFRKIFKGNG